MDTWPKRSQELVLHCKDRMYMSMMMLHIYFFARHLRLSCFTNVVHNFKQCSIPLTTHLPVFVDCRPSCDGGGQPWRPGTPAVQTTAGPAASASLRLLRVARGSNQAH